MMVPPTKSMKDEIVSELLRFLSTTPYACSSLILLVAGTTNFVFRGTLLHHLQHGNNNATSAPIRKDTVIIKHFAAFAAGNKDMPLDVSRCVITFFGSHFYYERLNLE